MEVEQVAGPDAFLERAGALLLADEARHNLAFGIVATARAHPELYPEFRGWVARTGGAVVGAALRTPPHNVVLVRPTDDRALTALAEAIEDDDVPGVVGAVPEIDPFASALAERHDAVLETRFEQGVYALHTVIPARETRGSMRPAERADRALLLEWVEAFSDGGAARERGPMTPGASSGASTRGSPAATRGSRCGRRTDGRSRSSASAGRRRTGSGSARSTRRRSTAVTATGARSRPGSRRSSSHVGGDSASSTPTSGTRPRTRSTCGSGTSASATRGSWRSSAAPGG